MKILLSLTLIAGIFSTAFAKDPDVRDTFDRGVSRGQSGVPVVATPAQEELMTLQADLIAKINLDAAHALASLRIAYRYLQISDIKVNPAPEIIKRNAESRSTFIPEELRNNLDQSIRQLSAALARAGLASEGLSYLELSPGFRLPQEQTNLDTLSQNYRLVQKQLAALDLSVLQNQNPTNSEGLFNLAYGEPTTDGSLQGPSIYHVLASPDGIALADALKYLGEGDLFAKLASSGGAKSPSSPTSAPQRGPGGSCLPPR